MNVQPEWLSSQRWFGGKGRAIVRVAEADGADFDDGVGVRLAILEVVYADGAADRYFVPLIPHGEVGEARDALADVRFDRAFLAAILEGKELGTRAGGSISFRPGRGVRDDSTDPRTAHARFVGAEQSNSSLIYDEALILKAFRRLQEGVNPEVEILRFLAEQTGFQHAPMLAGTVEYRPHDGDPCSLAVLQTFILNQGDGWSYTLEALAHRTGPTPSCHPEPARDDTKGGAYLTSIADLGRVTADLHLALASSDAHPAFTPQLIVESDVGAWQAGVTDRLDAALELLETRLETLPADVRPLGHHLLALRVRVREMIGGSTGLAREGAAKIRHHGDYHLGQVLKTATSWAIIDFEGEPLRPLSERRAHHTPLKDVAGMLRSFNYARHAALRAASRGNSGSLLASWEHQVRHAFLDAYLERARAAHGPFLPRNDQTLWSALDALELEKALYELQYELGNRPDWVAIPLTFLVERASTA